MRGQRSEWTEALRQHSRRRLQFALSRFGRSVGSVTVYIIKVAGTPCGLDRGCRIVVQLMPGGRVLVEDMQSDLYLAILQAAERAGRAVGRALGRDSK